MISQVPDFLTIELNRSQINTVATREANAAQHFGVSRDEINVAVEESSSADYRP